MAAGLLFSAASPSRMAGDDEFSIRFYDGGASDRLLALPCRYTGCVPVQGEYEPSPLAFAANQVALYEATGGAEGGTLQGKPVVILTMRGRHSGKVRKAPLMRVEHKGTYAVVASMGGAPKNPVWYLNLVASPKVTLQDGSNVYEMTAREVHGEERATWWRHAVDAWPAYDEYQTRTQRTIPVVVLEPAR